MVSSLMYIVLPVLLTLSLIRKYQEHKWGRCKSKKSLDGKVILITGANCGIGKETAKELAKRKARVIMACRSLDNARSAIKDIRSEVTSGELIPMHLDLSSLESVRKFAQQVLADFNKIDILINNAGVYIPISEKRKTVENFEIHFGVNHLGHFLLTELLSKHIKESAPSRIVIVSSGLHESGVLDMDDLNLEKIDVTKVNSRLNPAYCASKLANVYHSRELAEKLKGSGVSVFSVCPGFTLTNLFRYSKLKWWNYILFAPIAFFYLRTSWQGAQTVIHCAIDESLEDRSGEFYRNCVLYNSKVKFDPQVQKLLWEKSTSMVGLS